MGLLIELEGERLSRRLRRRLPVELDPSAYPLRPKNPPKWGPSNQLFRRSKVTGVRLVADGEVVVRGPLDFPAYVRRGDTFELAYLDLSLKQTERGVIHHGTE